MTEPEPVETPIVHVGEIPPLTTAEAIDLERIELDRFIELLESLPGEAWSVPVATTDWDVRMVAAHVAGTYAAQGSLNQLWRQVDPRVIRMYRSPGQSLAETLARIHIGDRLGHTPVELIEELREMGPRALRVRSVIYRPLQPVQISFSTGRISGLGLGPFAAIRDLWLHRLDVGEAAGVGLGLREEQDGRFVSLLLKSAVTAAEENLVDRTVDIIVVGLGDRRYRFGPGSIPDATIEIDPISLAKLAERRRSAAATRERSRIEGDVKVAMILLDAIRHS